MKYSKFLLLAASFAVISMASIKPAMAYFTDYVLAVGYRTIKVHDSELDTPKDTVENMVKTVSLKNTGDFPVYVRVKAICPDGITATGQDSEDWTAQDDGYYYYNEILGVDEETTNLNLKISEPTGDTAGNDFNVVIIQEATKVQYKEDGTTYADWDSAIGKNKPVDNTQAADNTENGGGENE